MTTVTLLAENTARGMGILGEHGLAWWIDTGAHRVLFDTGQGLVLESNARRLHVDLASAHAIALSHGHLDHVGGLELALAAAPQATLYLHPRAIEPKFTGSDGKVLKPTAAPKVPVDVPDSELTFDSATDVQVTRGVTYTVECPLPKGAESGRFAVANLPGGSARLSLLGVTGIGGGLLTLVGLGLTVGGLFGRFKWKRTGQAAPIPAMPDGPPTMSGPSSVDDD